MLAYKKSLHEYKFTHGPMAYVQQDLSLETVGTLKLKLFIVSLNNWHHQNKWLWYQTVRASLFTKSVRRYKWIWKGKGVAREWEGDVRVEEWMKSVNKAQITVHNGPHTLLSDRSFSDWLLTVTDGS